MTAYKVARSEQKQGWGTMIGSMHFKMGVFERGISLDHQAKQNNVDQIEWVNEDRSSAS